MLDLREQKILEAIIESYISVGEPVSSRTLVKKYDIDYSSATVRNIMADLEEAGYLEKSHTSSGRMPTSKGYKLYINSLLELQRLSQDEIKSIKQEYNDKNKELEQLLSNSSNLLSKMTSYAGFAIEPTLYKEKLQRIDLIYIDEHSFLVVVITDNSVKTKRVVLKSNNIDSEELSKLSFQINTLFKGELLDGVLLNFDTPLKYEQTLLQSFISQLESKVHGSENIAALLSHQDCQVIEASSEMKKFLEQLDTKGLDDKKINIIFGEDIDSEKLKDLSIVLSTYTTDSSKGFIGVIGPKRMQYGKVASLVDQIAKRVSKFVKGSKR